jgi:hypothetical protein
MFQELTQQLMQTIHPPDHSAQTQEQPHPEEQPEEELQWQSIIEDLPAAPQLQESSWPKIFRLAKELKRRAQIMTAGRDFHDIHTVLYIVAQWADLLQPTRNYVAHRMRLLYIAVTKGWPAALYYDQQGTDKYLDKLPTSASQDGPARIIPVPGTLQGTLGSAKDHPSLGGTYYPSRSSAYI